MKPKTMILMVVAVACGLGASYMTSKLLARNSNVPAPVETVDVVVTTARIPSWQPIKDPEKVLTVKKFPVDVAPKKPVSKIEDMKDKSLGVFLEEGKPVTEDDLVGKDSQDIASKIMPGQRAIAIKVTAESLAGGFIRPGSRVDIICTIRNPETSSRVILQNMLILAVGEIDTKDPTQKTLIGPTATLAATLDEGSRLSLGQSMGELRLVVRRPDDQEVVSNLVVRADDLSRPQTPREGTGKEQQEDPKTPEAAPIDVPRFDKEKQAEKEEPVKPEVNRDSKPQRPEEKPKRVIAEERAEKKKAEPRTTARKAPADDEGAEEEEPDRIIPPRILLNPPRPIPTHTMVIRNGKTTTIEKVATKVEYDAAQESSDEEEAPAAPPKKDEKANPQPRPEQPRNGPQPSAKTGSSTKTGRTRTGGN